MADVFISYHAKSAAETARRIVAALESAGISCWYAPRDVRGVFPRDIIQAIDACRIFLLLLDEQANESEHVLNEVGSAFNRMQRHEDIQILPFRLGEFPLCADLRYYLGRINMVNGGSADSPRIEELAARTARLLGRESPCQPAGESPSTPRRGLLSDRVSVTTLSTNWHTVGVREDGTVEAAGFDGWFQGVEDWRNILSVSAGGRHTVGLRENLTVLAAGEGDCGQCNVDGWTDIAAVSAGYRHTVGLRLDGTVVAVGQNTFCQCDMGHWSGITAVSAGHVHTVGLQRDGTVLAVGGNQYGQCNVRGWSDITAVSAGFRHTVGLRADGTVLATGQRVYGRCDVADWSGITAVSAGYYHTVGLRKDGTVLAVGDTSDGACDVEGWSDMVAVAAGGRHTVGLRADGTVLAVGKNEFGEGGLSAWRNIRLPEHRKS